MKRINITVDEETLAILEEERKKGIPFSFTIRGALMLLRDTYKGSQNVVRASPRKVKESNHLPPLAKVLDEMVQPTKKVDLMAEFIKKADSKS